jgi:uncharacterized protein involved in exopolysaccharide biosynthesis
MDRRVEKNTQSVESTAEQHFLLIALPLVWAKRKNIGVFVVAVTVVVAIVSFLLPNMYTAESSILPELEKNKLLGLATSVDLSSLTGFNVGEAPVSKLYPMIIKSARILREVIYKKYSTKAYKDSVGLVQFWDISKGSDAGDFEAALKMLRERMDVTLDNKLGTLVLKVEMEEPRLAADVANSITYELDLYTRTKRRTSVTAQREFIEQRMEEVEKALRLAENALRDFREKNRRVLDSPQLLLTQGRLEREVQINSTVFIELKKQIEVAKIEEIKNIPFINILDEARVPVVKSSPHRLTAVLSAFVITIVIAIIFAMYVDRLAETWNRRKQYLYSHSTN